MDKIIQALKELRMSAGSNEHQHILLDILEGIFKTNLPLMIESVRDRGFIPRDYLLLKDREGEIDYENVAFELAGLDQSIRQEVEAMGFHLEDAGTYISLIYPEYGQPRFYEEKDGKIPEIVFALNDRKYRLEFLVNSKELGQRTHEALYIREVAASTPETEWQKERPGRNYVQLFGQPYFCQHELLIHSRPDFKQDGKRTAIPLLFLWSGWGDEGTEQFFVKFSSDGEPIEVIREASCY